MEEYCSLNSATGESERRTHSSQAWTRCKQQGRPSAPQDSFAGFIRAEVWAH